MSDTGLGRMKKERERERERIEFGDFGKFCDVE